MIFTEEQQKEYLKNCGSNCPYCGEDNISGHYIETDGMDCWREVDCLNPDCLKTWTEVFTISYIE